MKGFFRAGGWSIIIPLSPLVGIALLTLLILMTSEGGESGLCAYLAAAELTFLAVLITPVTSIWGLIVATRALCRKRQITAIVGLVINIALFCTAAALLGWVFYARYNDPDRLNIAVIHGDTKTVKKLLNRGFDIEHRYTNDETSLHEGVGNPEMAKLLISRGADVNARDHEGRTPLFCLAALGRSGTKQMGSREATYEIADLLIQKGADIEAKSTGHFRTPANGSTPLHAAADSGYLFMIEKLIMEGANINPVNDQGETPLALAARRGDIDAARLLVESGADLNLSGERSGHPPLGAAIRSAKPQMVDYLLKGGADPHWEGFGGGGLIQMAAVSSVHPSTGGSVGTAILSMLIAAGADVNKGTSGHTPLSFVLSRCEIETSQRGIVKMLLENGATVDFAIGKKKTSCLDTVRNWKVNTEEEKKYRDEIISLLQEYKQKQSE